MEKKKTLVLGASENPGRYSNMAIRRLLRHGHPVVAVGNRIGEVEGVKIQTGQPAQDGINTVTLYMNSMNQQPFYDYILGLKPKRIIFNPGTENMALQHLAEEQGIETDMACTLVMLSIGQY